MDAIKKTFLILAVLLVLAIPAVSAEDTNDMTVLTNSNNEIMADNDLSFL